MTLLERELVITWVKALCRWSPQTDWIGVSMGMSEEQDERLAKVLFLAWAFSNGWEP